MEIKNNVIRRFALLFFIVSTGLFMSCGDDDTEDTPEPTGNELTYTLSDFGNSGVSGTATMAELNNGSLEITLTLTGTPAGGMHPAHIHANSAVETGDIIASLNAVDGDEGTSITVLSALDDGTPLTFESIQSLDGYINVHLSSEDLGTIVAQGDIGQNELTGEMKSYELGERAVAGITGSATLYERVSGETLAVLALENTPESGTHPAHIHNNTAAEGGGIAISFTSVDGTTGMSKTNIGTLDDGTAITYSELLEFDGYINVHLSAEDLGTIVAQGDIGQNELTGEMKSYVVGSRAVAGIENINGTATFYERVNGQALAELSFENMVEGGTYPAHIHHNTGAEGGDIAISFTPVDGNSGMSLTNIAGLDDGTAITYSDILDFDGYINVHLSADELETIVAQVDIGQNELNGESIIYDLSEKSGSGISGIVVFYERINGEVLAVIALANTIQGSHPAHIHNNTAAESGGIALSFNPVDGSKGISRTNITALDDGTPITYSELLDFDGYVNVHLSADELGTIVAQGDIGQNDLTGESISYDLEERAVAGISGTATFFERANGESLAVIALLNTPDGGSHPAHIHNNSASEGGGIAFTFNQVDGTTGMSSTNVSALDDETAITYSDLLDFDGYINVHLSADDLATLVAQGNIGSNN